MMEPATKSINASEVVQLQQHYSATCQQVFAAFSNAEALSQWFGPQSHKSSVEDFEFKVGGKYKIRFINQIDQPECSEQGVDPVCVGEYILIEQDKKIVMSFNWLEGGEDIGDTLLTIELLENQGGTDLVLTHEKVPTEELRRDHSMGWQSTLDSLQGYLSA